LSTNPASSLNAIHLVCSVLVVRSGGHDQERLPGARRRRGYLWEVERLACRGGDLRRKDYKLGGGSSQKIRITIMGNMGLRPPSELMEMIRGGGWDSEG